MTPAQLKALRKKLGLTQAQLGAELLVDRNTINRWEMGLHPIHPLAAKTLQQMGGDRRAAKKGK